MKYKVNNKEMNTDGDWIQCPECDEISFPLLTWMSYCPICQTELNFQGVVFAVQKDGE